MKKLLIIVLLFSLNIIAQETKPTTYYFIRHAEKIQNSTNDNPELTKKGKKRAVYWSEVFQHVNFDMIFSTNYKRTIATASPTAISKKLKIKLYDAKKLYSNEFQKITKGKTVLIVGHSNTTPQFVNKIIGKKKYTEINETNFSNLFIVNLLQDSMTDTLLKIDY